MYNDDEAEFEQGGLGFEPRRERQIARGKKYGELGLSSRGIS